MGCCIAQYYVEVTVSEGTLRGVHQNGLRIFKGIPYAAQPDRFKAPQAHGGWAGTRDALVSGAACSQYSPEDAYIVNRARSEADYQMYHSHAFSEDCLFLDVIVPDQTALGGEVLVWIHGGGLHRGSGTYNGLW